MGPSAAFHAFSLAPRTDISPETYAYPKLLTVLDGAMTVQAGRTAFFLSQGNSLIVPLGVAFGVHTEGGAIYTELSRLVNYLYSRTLSRQKRERLSIVTLFRRPI